MTPIQPIDIFFGTRGSSVRQIAETPEPEISFGQLVKSFIDSAEQAELADQANSMALANGSVDDLHTAMIAANKAELSLRYALQVRNKVVEAYQEITRMQV